MGQSLLADTTGERDVETALGGIHAVGTAARTANDLLGDVPGLVSAAESPVRQMLAAERRAVLEGVNSQRVRTLEYVTAERLATVAALREERIAVLRPSARSGSRLPKRWTGSRRGPSRPP